MLSISNPALRVYATIESRSYIIFLKTVICSLIQRKITPEYGVLKNKFFYNYIMNQSEPETLVPVPETQSIWEELKEAVRGTEADYTRIGLRKAIFLLAVPMILELVMESTFAIVDIFFIGKLGASAVATVGLTETFLFLLYSVAMGLATAVTAIIARRVGEKNKEKAGITAVQAIMIGLILSLPFALAGIFYARELLTLMGADEWSITYGYRYTQWMLGGNVVIMLLFVINAVFRGAGDAAIAMRVLWFANGINIVLDISDAHPCRCRQRSRSGRYDCIENYFIYDDARLGIIERNCDARRSEPRRKPTRPCRIFRVENRSL